MSKKTTKKQQAPDKNTKLLHRIATWVGSKPVFVAVLVLFALQATFLVFATNPGTPPDENNHWRFINFYADNSLSPIFSEQEPTSNLGDKTREPDYLYHYLMSLVVRVMPFTEDTERFAIRLLSVGIAVVSFIFLAKVLRKLRISDTITTLTILLLTQLSMVLMVSSAVNNDTMVWLGMTVGLWLLLEIWEKPRAIYVLYLLMIPAYGGLFKRTLLPIAAALCIAAAILLWQKRSEFIADIKHTYKTQLPLLISLLIVLSVGIGLSAERIGGNYLRYGKVVPTCEDVQGEEACWNFWASHRARELAQRTPDDPIAVPEFAVRWSWESIKNIIDIQTQWWRHEKVPPGWLTPFSIALLAIGLAYGALYDGRRVKIDAFARKRLVVLAIGLYYIVFHMAFNYGEFQQFGKFGLALNGRYILAGLFPIVGLVLFYWTKLLRKWPLIQFGFIIVVITLFAVYSGFSLLIRNPQLFNG